MDTQTQNQSTQDELAQVLANQELYAKDVVNVSAPTLTQSPAQEYQFHILPHCVSCGTKHSSGYQRCEDCFQSREKKCVGRCGTVLGMAEDPELKGKDKCKACYLESKRMVAMIKNDSELRQSLYEVLIYYMKRDGLIDENVPTSTGGKRSRHF